ncbi:hypothetical protein BBAD15_g7162 [Beauveria bassiana D1-5]|uniref:Uncharacterized protein n=1 Tax=Beauveria bassiana D1-5 TaxID=1245745 RepID=A0A0A2VHZ8_BEABA|nr:hypothetical protein BBAD15_g7162 [Beauveria bassiana D1-5]
MAVAVAHALMRTIRGRPTDTPASPSPPLPPSSAPPSLSDGLVFAAHQDTQLASSSSFSSYSTTTQPLPPPDTPLSIATALVGLVAASHHTFHDILDLPLAPRSRTASLQTLRRAVQSLKLTAPLALKWLRRVESAPDLLPTGHDRPALVDVDALIVIVSEAVDAVSAAGQVLVAVVREAAATTTTEGDLPTRLSDVVPGYTPEIVAVSERIQQVEHLLSKLLTILQMYATIPLVFSFFFFALRRGVGRGEQTTPTTTTYTQTTHRRPPAEAARTRAAIDASLPLIMGSNPALASSVRLMPDSFGALAAFPASLLDRAPPSYSLPPPHIPEALPDYAAAAASTDGSVAIRPGGWSVFAPLTLADLAALSRVPLPLRAAEGEFAAGVGAQVCELMERPGWAAKAKQLAVILGSRTEAVALTHEENFARTVALESEQSTTTDGRPGSRPRPNIIIGGS